jgi:3-deoxy-manno-octulosonate cytidylyltransferase (CMP-KDO synthetase)
MKSVVVIPARYASTRYPGKPLVPLLGRPMLSWVYDIGVSALGKESTYVATDDDRIFDYCVSNGMNVIMTRSDCLTGTDRLADFSRQVSAEIYINLQGDEPMVDPRDILKVVAAKRENYNSVINCYTELSDSEDPCSENIPKVVVSQNGRLLYMSRAAVPGFKDSKNKPANYFKQVCIYAFSPAELDLFSSVKEKGSVERSEDIEILRFLEFDVPVKMLRVDGGSLAVDIPEDVARVEAALGE